MSSLSRITRLSRPALYLLAAHFIVFTALVSSGVFVSAYVFQLTGDVWLLGVFYLAIFSSWSGVLFITAPLCKRGGALTSLRWGLALYLIYYLLLSTLQEQIADVIILVGLVHGAAAGCYWLPANQLCYEFNKPYERQEFLSLFSIVLHLAQLLAPITIGALIWWTKSYLSAFVAFVALFAWAFRLSLLMDQAQDLTHTTAYDTKPIWRALYERIELRNTLIANLLIGFSIWGAMAPVMYALMHRATQNELVMGEIASLMPFLGLSISYLIKKSNAVRLRQIVLIAGGVLFANSLLLLFLPITQASIIIFAFLQAGSSAALTVVCNIHTFNTLDHYDDLQNSRTEYLACREHILNIGRTSSSAVCLAIVWLGSSDTIYGLSYFFYGVTGLLASLIFSRLTEPGKKEEV